VLATPSAAISSARHLDAPPEGSTDAADGRPPAADGPVRTALDERHRTAIFQEQLVPLIDVLHHGASRYTRDPDDAEDLVQDTLVKAYRKFHQFEQGSNLKSWLFRILHTTYLSDYRRRRRRPAEVPEDPTAGYSVYDRLVAAEGSAEYRVLDRFGVEEVRVALAELPPRTRESVYLKDVEGFSYREIAEITDTPVNTVESRLHRGRKSLAASLHDYARRQGRLGREHDEWRP
jgi:RNA polymerase sigma-70 factor (ECF subfamily)